MFAFPKIRRAFKSAGQLNASPQTVGSSIPLPDDIEQETLRRACCLDLVSSSGCMTENGAHALMSYFSRDF